MSTAQKEFRVRRLDQFRALGSPARQEILRTVETSGPCSIAEIARALGRPADSLYYHIRKLHQVGLLVDRGSRRSRREEQVYDVPGRPMVTFDPDDAACSSALVRATGALLRVTERNVRDAFAHGEAVTRGPEQNVAAHRAKGWLTQEQTQEVLSLLERAQSIVNQGAPPDDGRNLMAVSLFLTPIQPVERGKDENLDGHDPSGA